MGIHRSKYYCNVKYRYLIFIYYNIQMFGLIFVCVYFNIQELVLYFVRFQPVCSLCLC